MEKNGKILMGKYAFGKLLGQGNFARVYHARDLRTGKSVAVKVFDKIQVLNDGMQAQTKREILIMRRVKHPNVLRLHEVLATKTKIYFIVEYAKGGELFNKITKGEVNENQARTYFKQLISGLDFCHKNGVYHRDLKPENLLLDENGILKISDFGLSSFVESHHRENMLQTICGTPTYIAPEILCRKGYHGEKTDVWACGVVLYVLLAGHYPFYDSNIMNLYRKIYHGKYKCPKWFSLEVCTLLKKMLNTDPKTRISMDEIMENPWFRKGIHSEIVEVNGEITNVAADLDSDKIIESCETENESVAVEPNQELVQPKYLNAFHILSLSEGLDLSVLFATDSDEKEDIKFTSKSSVSSIISTIENIAHILKMKIEKNKEGILKFERSRERHKEPLTIFVEIFEFAPSFYLVEIKKSCGDALEYQKVLREHIRPALKDIVWIWQGEQQHANINNINKVVCCLEEIN